MTQLGSLLKEAREGQGLSLEEVEEATRIRQKYLHALETGDYTELPPAIYARGLLRSYARYLGVDLEEALKLYSQETPARQAGRGPTFLSQPLSTRRRLDPELVLGLVILAAVVVALAWVVREYILPLAQAGASGPATVETPAGVVASTPQPFAVAVTATPAPTMIPAPTSSPAAVVAQIELQITLTGDTSVQVQVDGETAFEGDLAQGESRSWVARRAVALRAEDGGVVTVTVNGREEGALGKSGQAASLVWVLGPDGKPVRLAAPGGGG